MKKIIVALDLQDNQAKRKAMKTVSTLTGIDSITMDMKEKKLTITGAVDPVSLVSKLRKHWPDTAIVLVGPAKEPEKPAPPAEKKPEEAAGDKKPGEEGAKPGEEGKKDDKAAAGKEGEAGGEKKEGEGGKDGEKKDGGGEKKDGDAADDVKKEGQKKPQPVMMPHAPPMYFNMPPQYRPPMMVPPAYNYYYNTAPHPAQMSMYHPHHQQHYYSPSVEENPNACTIC